MIYRPLASPYLETFFPYRQTVNSLAPPPCFNGAAVR